MDHLKWQFLCKSELDFWKYMQKEKNTCGQNAIRGEDSQKIVENLSLYLENNPTEKKSV